MHLGGNFGAAYLQEYFDGKVDPWSSYYSYTEGWFNQLSLHTRYVIRQGPAQLYTQLNVGYGFPHDNGYYQHARDGGFMLRPALGTTIAARSETRFYTQLAWNMQHVEFDLRRWNGLYHESSRERAWMDVFLVSLGIQFNARRF